MDEFKDGWVEQIRDGCIEGSIDKCKVEIVFVASQMYGWMD